jgi:hypothetical protein
LCKRIAIGEFLGAKTEHLIAYQVGKSDAGI